MSIAANRPLLLAHASPADVAREVARRIKGRLAGLPDGKSWTRMDFVFASIVVVLALSSTGFFTATYRIFSADPDYFSRRLIASMETNRLDPIETGTVSLAASGDGRAEATEAAMPVPQVHRARAPVPGDYEIVMIFGDEALLATSRELWRVKVGSVVPGLGTILSIDGSTSAVRSENATLQMVAE